MFTCVGKAAPRETGLREPRGAGEARIQKAAKEADCKGLKRGVVGVWAELYQFAEEVVRLAKNNGIKGMDEVVTFERKCGNWVKLYSEKKDG